MVAVSRAHSFSKWIDECSNSRERFKDIETPSLLFSSTDPFRSFNFSRSSFFSYFSFFLSLPPLFQEKNFFFSSVSPILDTRLNAETRKASRHSSFVFHPLFPRHWTVHVHPPFLLSSYLRPLFRFDRVSTTFLLCFFFLFFREQIRVSSWIGWSCAWALVFLSFFLISFLYLLLIFFRLWV